MNQFRLLITAHSFGSCSPGIEEEMKHHHIDAVHIRQDNIVHADQLAEMIDEYDGIIVGADILSREVIEKAARLKIIAKHGVGLDNVDLDAARERGIPVTIAKNSNSVAVAEQAIALMIALAKNIEYNSQNVKSGIWKRSVGKSLSGATIGVLGTGSIGKEVIKRAFGLEMKILAYDVYPDENFLKRYNGQYANLETILSKSDFVSIHLPYIPETKHIINKKTLHYMKSESCLINTARGGLINEADLYDALATGLVSGAGIDTFEQEPPTGSRLLELKNVIASPHTGAYTNLAIDNMSRYALASVVDLIEGREVRNRV